MEFPQILIVRTRTNSGYHLFLINDDRFKQFVSAANIDTDRLNTWFGWIDRNQFVQWSTSTETLPVPSWRPCHLPTRYGPWYGRDWMCRWRNTGEYFHIAAFYNLFIVAKYQPQMVAKFGRLYGTKIRTFSSHQLVRLLILLLSTVGRCLLPCQLYIERQLRPGYCWHRR